MSAFTGKQLRAFSMCGPCIEQGTIIKHTERSVTIMTRAYGPARPGQVVRRGGYDWHANGTRPLGEGLLHVEPCPSCCDHTRTQYPNGYMD